MQARKFCKRQADYYKLSSDHPPVTWSNYNKHVRTPAPPHSSKFVPPIYQL